MNQLLLFINWTVKPEIISEPITIRWYGLFFGVGFLLAYHIVKKMMQAENVDEKILDKLLVWVIIATVIGARLGHVFFYDWNYYSQHLTEIPQFWKGGLASHGGAIAIAVAVIIFAKRVIHKSPLWIFDKIVVAVALTGCFIRIGNLFNHEIVGTPTDLPFGFIFERLQDGTPRHPSQLYEAMAYFILFWGLLWGYWKTKAKFYQGRIFGWFLTLLFSVRFFIEFTKVNQTDIVNGWALNMGQILSIPAILCGIYLIIRSYKYKIDIFEEKKSISNLNI